MTDFRDPRLHEALKAAPDDALRPAPQTRDAILAQAHAAVAAPPFYVRGWRQAMALLGGSGRPWNAAFATLLVAGFVTVLWQGREVPPAAEPAPAVADVAAPAAVAVPYREPLQPPPPRVAQDTSAPDGPVIEMMVLLKVDLMCACPTGTDLRSRRRGLRAACF